MKKSLLLSIVMTLVLVVAMSTATFAWYVSNASVSASTASITASTSGSNLLISDADETTPGPTINFAAAAAPVAPMMPTAQDLSSWTTANQSAGNNPTVTYSSATVAYWDFNLSNVGAADDLDLTFSISNESDATSGYLRWAVKQGNKVVGCHADAKVLTKSTTTVQDGEDLLKAGEQVAALGSETYTLEANASNVAFTLYLWFEGQNMTNNLAGSVGSITLNIRGAVAAQ